MAALNAEKNRYAALAPNVTFAFHAASNTFQLRLLHNDWNVSLSPGLAKKFKVEIPTDAIHPPTYRVPHDEDSLTLNWNIDFYENRRMLYILCDQAPYQMIANAAYPILACFPIGGAYEHKELIQFTFYQNHYHSLDCGKILNGMSIQLTDEKMKPLKGIFDHAYCLVHLRRKKLV